MIRDLPIQVGRFLAFVLVQALLLRRLVLFDTGFCFAYVGFLLFLPIQLPRFWALLIGFVTGFTLDLFYDTGGLHAAASVLLAFVRPAQLRLVRPRDGYDTLDAVNGQQMGWGWWLGVTLPLVLLHHLAVFWLEVGQAIPPLFTFAKVLVSAVFTELTLLIAQLVFFAPRRR